MKKIIFALISILCLALLAIFYTIANHNKNKPFTNNTNTIGETSRTSFNLPIDSRGYKVGISGFLPANFPSHSISDTNTFLNDTNSYSEIYGVHVK